MGNSAPIEAKVYAGTLGGGIGFELGQGVIWLLGVTVWHASPSSAAEQAAIAAVPTTVANIVQLALAAGLAFLGGYLARHTPRVLDALESVGSGTPAPEADPGVMTWQQADAADTGSPQMGEPDQNAELLNTDGTENVQPWQGVPDGFDDGRDPSQAEPGAVTEPPAGTPGYVAA